MLTATSLRDMLNTAADQNNVRLDADLALAALDDHYDTTEAAEAAIASLILDDGPWYAKAPTYVYLWEDGAGGLFMSVHDRDNNPLGAYRTPPRFSFDLRGDVEALLEDGADIINAWAADGTDPDNYWANLAVIHAHGAEVVATFTATGRHGFDVEIETPRGRFAGGGAAREALTDAGYDIDED